MGIARSSRNDKARELEKNMGDELVIDGLGLEASQAPRNISYCL